MTTEIHLHRGIFRKGDGRKRGHPPIPAEVRFWIKVDRRGDDECWPWMAGLTRAGYGQFQPDRKTGQTHIYAHRFSYELLVGPIPEGLTIDHLCRNRQCVNPRHLEPVTNKENGLRGISVAAMNARKTHCAKGHPYSKENIYVFPSKGGRKCRICLQRELLESQRRRRAKRRLLKKQAQSPQ
jgi:hypothetical protein